MRKKKKQVYPWTCLGCGRAMAKSTGSKERLCHCKDPVVPTKDQINAGPWVGR